MTWTLPEPMLAAPVSDPALLPGWAAEVKWDGWRAMVSVDAGRLVLRSRKGADLAPSFPEVTSGNAQLPDATALDGELVVWDAAGRLAFERLQGRMQRRGAGAARVAEQWPTHFVAFDLLRVAGVDTTKWPYQRRRAKLETLFTDHRLTAPWALCPATTDEATVREWLTSWTAVGVEGVVYKKLDGLYEPSVRGWRKHKIRETEDAIVGAFTGSPASPRTLLLGRYDTDGHLRYVGRSTTLPPPGLGPGRRPAPHLSRNRTPLDRLDVLRRMGHPRDLARHPRPARPGRGGRCRRRPGQRRTLAAPRPMASAPPRPAPGGRPALHRRRSLIYSSVPAVPCAPADRLRPFSARQISFRYCTELPA